MPSQVDRNLSGQSPERVVAGVQEHKRNKRNTPPKKLFGEEKTVDVCFTLYFIFLLAAISGAVHKVVLCAAICRKWLSLSELTAESPIYNLSLTYAYQLEGKRKANDYSSIEITYWLTARTESGLTLRRRRS